MKKKEKYELVCQKNRRKNHKDKSSIFVCGMCVGVYVV